MISASRQPSVFICYMKDDVAVATSIYDFLLDCGADPWLDKKRLVLGDDWKLEIKRAVERSDACVICIRPRFEERGFRHNEVRWAIDALQSRPLGHGYIIPFIIEPCELPNWCKDFHAGDPAVQRSHLDDLLPAINKHCSADLSPRRLAVRKRIELILDESALPPFYRRKIMLLLYGRNEMRFYAIRKECRKPPYSREKFLEQWQSLLDGEIMASTGPHPDPACCLTPVARSILDEFKDTLSKRRESEEIWPVKLDLPSHERQNLRVVELAYKGFSSDSISKKLNMSVTEVAAICRTQNIPTKRFKLERGEE